MKFGLLRYSNVRKVFIQRPELSTNIIGRLLAVLFTGRVVTTTELSLTL